MYYLAYEFCPALHGSHVFSSDLDWCITLFAILLCMLSLTSVFLFSKGWGGCLDDEPAKHDFKFPTMLPGVIYDADHQCRLQYGLESSHCTGMMVSCTCFRKTRTPILANEVNAHCKGCMRRVDICTLLVVGNESFG